MGYAASLLEQNGFEARLLDGVVEKMAEDAFISRVTGEAPDLVFLEVSTPSWQTDAEVIRRVAESLPGTPIILGGLHEFMYDDRFFASYPWVHATVRGEYETALLEIAHRIRSGTTFRGIPGVVWRKEDESVQKERLRPLIENLDALPWPHRSQLPMDRYIDGLLELPQPSLQMWASRGCPFRCSFCAWPQLMYEAGAYRVRSPEDVVMEMIVDGREKGFRSVYFDDDVFNVGDKRMARFVELLKCEEWNLPFGIMARADTCSTNMYEDLRSVGLEVMKLGVESADQDLVNGCGKRLAISSVREAVAQCKSLGIRTHLTFMFGLPGETPDSARKTIDLALELSPETVQFSLATPFPGSSFYRELEERGYLVSKDWALYDGYSRSVVRTDLLSAQELEETLRTAYREWESHKTLTSSRPQWIHRAKQVVWRLVGR
jgi:radical SAM superfamily enzyme YgiQ (UPF0313 family)